MSNKVKKAMEEEYNEKKSKKSLGKLNCLFRYNPKFSISLKLLNIKLKILPSNIGYKTYIRT